MPYEKSYMQSYCNRLFLSSGVDIYVDLEYEDWLFSLPL